MTVAQTEPELAVELDRSLERRRLLRRVARSRVTALLVFDVVFIAVVGAVEPDFLRWENFRVIFDNMALGAIVMVGTVFLLAAGRFDLSIDGVAVLSGIICGLLMASHGVPGPLAFVGGLVVGLAAGLVNGAAIEYGGLNPLVTTLGMWWLTIGIALGLTQGYSPFGFPSSFTAIAQTRVGGLLILVVYAIVFIAVMAAVLTFSRFGAHVYATGGDREASRLNGVKVQRIGLWLYGFSGLLAGFAGVAFASRLNTASASAFDGLALDVIAAAVIGGASLNGGRGSVLGGLLGLLLLNLFGNAAIYVGISPFWQKGISGLILLVAVAADAFAARREQAGPGQWRWPWRHAST